MASSAIAILPSISAAAINIEYHAARASVADGVRHLMAAGAMLLEVKAKLGHGEFLPWVEEHCEFHIRAAQRMMKVANASLTTHLDDDEALLLIRQIWGNDTGSLMVQSKANRWFTPRDYVDAARRVMGGIDLDPASSETANKTIKAAVFYTEDDDGLGREWSGRVWLNPPYGRKAGDFVARLVDLYETGAIKAAVTLVNAHCTDTAWFQRLWSYSLCFTDHRINFHAGEEQEASGSTHGSAFIYLGPERNKFVAEFDDFGAIVERVTL